MADYSDGSFTVSSSDLLKLMVKADTVKMNRHLKDALDDGARALELLDTLSRALTGTGYGASPRNRRHSLYDGDLP